MVKRLFLFITLMFVLASPSVLAEKSSRNRNFVIPLPVNINHASVEVLDQALEGIGAQKAQAIVDYRETNGPFLSVDDLVKVKGIGAGTLERNRSRISVN